MKITELEITMTPEQKINYLKDKIHAAGRELYLVRKAIYDLEPDCYIAEIDALHDDMVDSMSEIDSALERLSYRAFIIGEELEGKR